jgi:hypothetical protein
MKAHTKQFGNVTVYVNDGLCGGEIGATIGWGSPGAVSVEYTAAYIADMQAAVEYAKEINSKSTDRK